MLKIVKNWQKVIKNIDIYNIGYITIKKIDNCENINSVNTLYLRITHANGYIKEKGVNKYLAFKFAYEFISGIWAKMMQLT